ncbi:MAG: sulfatase-like hydrolase/transferase [Bryobacterales bacterium]|nr:sulfatase-like hydrolase/transferase [Bryobacterales bacterium]
MGRSLRGGNPWLRTPAMDSLAQRGVLLSRSYCPYPVCSPSRSSIFTGRMPHETGVMENGLAIKPGIATMGEVFRNAGYRTVYGGKWHLPKSFDGMTGFEKLIGGNGLGRIMDRPLARRCSEWLLNEASQRFLMVASFMNPHDICSWIREHPGARSYSERSIFPGPPGNMAVDPDEPEYLQFHRHQGYDLMSKGVGIAAEWREADVSHYRHDYYRMVEAVDDEIGRLLEALRVSGLEDDTLICFASDHGEGMGAHRWVQKAAFWEETVRVPFLFAGAGVPRRGVIDHESLATLADILPTFCDFAGIAAPPKMRGISLRGTLEGNAGSRPFVVSQLQYRDDFRQGRMLRSARYKYIVFSGGERPEQFFDLEADPGEVRNLARDPAAKEILGTHRAMLGGWLAETADPFRIPAVSGRSADGGREGTRA